MKVAIIHYWLVKMRGGERVLEALCDMYPQADIYTHVYNEEAISDKLKRHRIYTTFISRLPYSVKLYKKYLPLMPRALEELDLRDYDLIISSESGPAKGVIPSPESLHVCYTHSPMRYIWDQYYVYRQTQGIVQRALMSVIAHRLRSWDVSSSNRVDAFIANSTFVRKRIKKYYRRDSDVVYPPINVENYSKYCGGSVGDYYLWVGELASYKRPDIAIAAFKNLDKRLVVVGDGDEFERLVSIATPNIEFRGSVRFDDLRELMAGCIALIYPGVEDFGMIPVEVMAAGRPVIAFSRGGVLDTVVPGKTGVLYPDSSAGGLEQAIIHFESNLKSEINPEDCIYQANKFSSQVFKSRIAEIVSRHGF